MPRAHYAEISVGRVIEDFPTEAGLWNDYAPMNSFVNFSTVKVIAKRYLTHNQYMALILIGKYNMSQREAGIVTGKTSQALGLNLAAGIKKMRNIIEKHFQNGVYIGGGFKEHAKTERRLLNRNI